MFVVRARHIKGLLDAPICCIEDNTEPRYLMSAPSGQDFRQQYYPPASTRFSARGHLLPAVGVGEKSRYTLDKSHVHYYTNNDSIFSWGKKFAQLKNSDFRE